MRKKSFCIFLSQSLGIKLYLTIKCMKVMDRIKCILCLLYCSMVIHKDTAVYAAREQIHLEGISNLETLFSKLTLKHMSEITVSNILHGKTKVKHS